MDRPAILLLGAGGHARSCIDVLEQEERYQIAGLLGRHEEAGARVLGYAVIGFDADMARHVPSVSNALVAVGQIRSPDTRARLRRMALEAGFSLPCIVSPLAYVSRHAGIGSGTIVMHQAFVNAGVAVGVNCIINSRSHLDHDVRVDDDCHVSTGAVLNGGVRVGRGCFVGSGALVMEDVELAPCSIVPIGSIVSRHNAFRFAPAAATRQA